MKISKGVDKVSPFKPMKLRDYLKWIQKYGWYIKKGGVDWKLYNESEKLMVRNIIVTHPGKEVVPISVNKTKLAFQAEGLEQEVQGESEK